MKKLLLFFIAVFMLFISPVSANAYDNNYNNEYIQYKLDSEDNDEEPNFVFWGMLIVAFLAISVFLIAYKSDDDL